MNLSSDSLEPAAGNDSGVSPEQSFGASGIDDLGVNDSGANDFRSEESRTEGSQSDEFESVSLTSFSGEGFSDGKPASNEKTTDSMEEYYQLKQELLIITVVISIFVFGCVWFFYSLNDALNYLLGACTSVVYLRLLARNVEQLGSQKQKLGRSQLAIFVGLIIVATQWNQLKVLPIFLGFLTYKATLLIIMLRSVFASNST